MPAILQLFYFIHNSRPYKRIFRLKLRLTAILKNIIEKERIAYFDIEIIK